MHASGNTFSLRSAKNPYSRVGSFPPSFMRGSTAAKSVVGWRFAPACCAAQPVCEARRRSAVHRSATAWCQQTTQLQDQVCWSSASRRWRNAVLQSAAAPLALQAVLRLPARLGNEHRLRFSYAEPLRRPVAQLTSSKLNTVKVPALARRRQCWRRPPYKQ